jgi:predicted anti-sigma-YlaC factor YlaD
LLSEERLSAEQGQALREHLNTCEACRTIERAWLGAQQLIRRSGVAAPAPGFTARWQARLADERRRRAQRQAWGMLLATGSVAMALMLALGAQALDLFRAPQQVLMFAVYRLFSLYYLGQASLDILPDALSSLVGILPFTVWVFTLGIASVLGVLWIVAYQKIIAFWRIRV